MRSKVSKPRRRTLPRRGSLPALGARALAVALVLLLGGDPLEARQERSGTDLRREILESQRRLEEIRAERGLLQQEMQSLRARVLDASGELRNVERQLSASRSVLAEIEFQMEATAQRADGSTGRLLATRDELREREALLNRRLRDIYKRGPLHTTRVLIGADSFVDLLNRYRYLEMMAAYDRTLVRSVRDLARELEAQDRDIRESVAELSRLRDVQLGELAELRRVEQDRQFALTRYRSEERTTIGRLEDLEADEVRLTGLVSDLERRRVDEERRGVIGGREEVPADRTLGAIDMRTLAWPVQGEILYRFGPERRPDGTVRRWNGIGIGAASGSPVRAVRDGTAVMAGPFEGYGPSVILSHGGGFYTLYLYLEDIGVVQGRSVSAGQVVGTVGGRGTADGPYVEFQVRAPIGGGPPTAQDPLEWLRPQGP